MRKKELTIKQKNLIKHLDNDNWKSTSMLSILCKRNYYYMLYELDELRKKGLLSKKRIEMGRTGKNIIFWKLKKKMKDI
ncbi:MAG: hypothetical protein ACE5J9_04365 [Methanosarcinales archaeon]